MSSLPPLNLPTDRVLLGTLVMWNACRSRRRRSSGTASSCVAGTTRSPPTSSSIRCRFRSRGRAGSMVRKSRRGRCTTSCISAIRRPVRSTSFVNKPLGAKLAYARLEEQIAVMWALRGASVVPVGDALFADVPGQSWRFTND